MHGKPEGALAFHISPSTLCQEIRFPWGIQSLGTPRPAIAPSGILKSVYISVVMLLWGMISTLSGVTTNFSGMVAIRFFLGFVEAAFLPGALMILSKWCTLAASSPRETPSSSAATSFPTLSPPLLVLAYCLTCKAHWAMPLGGGFSGSRAPQLCSLPSPPDFLPDLPHNTRGFTKEELEVAQLRMTEDVGVADVDSEDMGTFGGLMMAVKDVKVYIMMFVFALYVVGLSFNAYFPTLTKTLGFGYVPTLPMSAPPWVFSCIFSMCVAYSSDKYQEKFWHIVGPVCMGMAGFIISMSTEIVAARYVALFLQAGSYAGFIVFYSWISSSFPRPPAKRAVAIAMINAFSQVGNIAGSYVWSLPANGYRGSYAITLAMFGATIIGCFLFRVMLNRLNRELELKEVAYNGVGSEEVVDPNDEKLQLAKGFRYLV